MRNFQNKFKQNSIMFLTFFIGGSLIKYMLDASNIWYTAGSMSLGGMINSFTAFIAVFLIFIFPFRPVRRFIWNHAFGKFYTVKNSETMTSQSIVEKFTKPASEKESFETLDQKLSRQITSTKVNDNHFIVKIK